MRYLTPVLLLATGGFVVWYNGAHEGSVMMVPFLERIMPSLQGDPAAQGRVSAVVFFGLGALFLILAIARDLRDARARASIEGE